MNTAVLHPRFFDWKAWLIHLLGVIVCTAITLNGIASVWVPAQPLPYTTMSVEELGLSIGLPFYKEQHACGLVKYGVNSSTDWMGRSYNAVNCDRQEQRNFIYWRMFGPQFVKIAAPAFYWLYYTNHSQAMPHKAGGPLIFTNCQRPIDANDGCSGAQANGSSGIDATILTRANNNTPYPSVYPNNAPIRDYPVGYDPTLARTPASLWLPPASYHCSLGGGHSFFCTFSQATCGNFCDVKNIDFDNYRVVPSGPSGGTGTWNVWNNRFRCGSDIDLKDGNMWYTGSANFNQSIRYNEFDGNVAVCNTQVNGIGSNTKGVDYAHPITNEILYNDFHDMPARAMNVNATNQIKNVNWNSAQRIDFLYFAVQHTSIDSTAGTITFVGPFYNAGAKRVMPGRNDCRWYTTGSPGGGSTGISGTIGTQISGTPGGAGVYNFSGATGNLTDKTIDCGSALHGEFDGMNVDNNGKANEMNYIGNLVIEGNDCSPINTGLIVYLSTGGFFVSIGKSLLSNNILINRTAGDGTWIGCAAHIWSNNGPAGYDDLTIRYNWTDNTNQSAPQPSSCWLNNGGFSVVGSQSLDVLTVTDVNADGVIPIGTQIAVGATRMGLITALISVNPVTGVGTYRMSDSRTQASVTYGIVYAANQATAGGAIPYIATNDNNVNMKDGSIFSFTEATMSSSTACHA